MEQLWIPQIVLFYRLYCYMIALLWWPKVKKGKEFQWALSKLPFHSRCEVRLFDFPTKCGDFIYGSKLPGSIFLQKAGPFLQL